MRPDIFSSLCHVSNNITGSASSLSWYIWLLVGCRQETMKELTAIALDRLWTVINSVNSLGA